MLSLDLVEAHPRRNTPYMLIFPVNIIVRPSLKPHKRHIYIMSTFTGDPIDGIYSANVQTDKPSGQVYEPESPVDSVTSYARCCPPSPPR